MVQQGGLAAAEKTGDDRDRQACTANRAHAVDRNVGKEVPHLGADIDDAGMRAGAEDDQSELAHMRSSALCRANSIPSKSFQLSATRLAEISERIDVSIYPICPHFLHC